MKWAYKKANLKEAARHKRYYDHKFKCMKLIPGDTVLVRVKAFRADRKTIGKWEQKPYIVLEQMANQPVFKVKPVDDNDESNVRTLHCNMLFPVQLDQEESAQVDVIPTHSNAALQKANLVMDAYFDSF